MFILGWGSIHPNRCRISSIQNRFCPAIMEADMESPKERAFSQIAIIHDCWMEGTGVIKVNTSDCGSAGRSALCLGSLGRMFGTLFCVQAIIPKDPKRGPLFVRAHAHMVNCPINLLISFQILAQASVQRAHGNLCSHRAMCPLETMTHTSTSMFLVPGVYCVGLFFFVPGPVRLGRLTDERPEAPMGNRTLGLGEPNLGGGGMFYLGWDSFWWNSTLKDADLARIWMDLS